LSNPNNNGGSPLDEGGPKWASVEAERDYWKKLALEYGAKLSVLKHTMDAAWKIVQDAEGQWWIVQDGGVNRVGPMPSLEDVAKQLNLKLD
jgi:hypothetical protein